MDLILDIEDLGVEVNILEVEVLVDEIEVLDVEDEVIDLVFEFHVQNLDDIVFILETSSSISRRRTIVLVCFIMIHSLHIHRSLVLAYLF